MPPHVQILIAIRLGLGISFLLACLCCCLAFANVKAADHIMAGSAIAATATFVCGICFCASALESDLWSQLAAPTHPLLRDDDEPRTIAQDAIAERERDRAY